MSESAVFELKPKTFEEALQFATMLSKSELVPKCYRDKPENIIIATQMGHEIGLTWMRALRTIAVINGRAAMWGDDMLAMCLAHKDCEYIDESESTETVGVCTIKRKGHPIHTQRFTIEDARKAKLLDKPGPWQEYRPRMLKLRARGFALRDKWTDALAGLITVEEARDLPPTELDVQPAGGALPAPLKERMKEKVEKPPVPQIEGKGETIDVEPTHADPVPATETTAAKESPPDLFTEPEQDSTPVISTGEHKGKKVHDPTVSMDALGMLLDFYLTAEEDPKQKSKRKDHEHMRHAIEREIDRRQATQAPE